MREKSQNFLVAFLRLLLTSIPAHLPSFGTHTHAMNTAEKLDAPLDDLVASPRGGVRRGGRGPPKGDGVGFRNTAGKSHMKGATLQEIAAAPEDERCDPPARYSATSR